jgi:hypothetical protein
MKNNYQALAGTVNPNFRIGGANGVTVYQGFSDPNASELIGNNGDLYVLLTTTPALFQWTISTWLPLSTDQTFVRTKITTQVFIATNTMIYLGATLAGTTIFLPGGTPNKRFVIKDESGGAFTSPIIIKPLSPDTIDGQTTATIDVNYGSLSMMYGDDGWFIL